MLKKEYHIDYNELAHGDEYEGEFAEYYCPGMSCAICVYLPYIEEMEAYFGEPWERLMFADLEAIGLQPGEHVWVEVDY